MNYHVPYTDAVPIRAVAPSECENREFVDQHMEVKKTKSTAKDTKMSKRPRKGHKARLSEEQVKSGDKVQRENHNDDYHEVNIDISGVPAPFCSCTGIARGCYKWGTAGWQSKCCTTTLSVYPLPMSASKPGARLSGRKMSPGAYKKVLCRLAAEGYDLSDRVDLKDHWAKHGTNKYIKIK